MLVLPNADDVRAARAFLNWTQPTLAYKCDVSVKTITSIEKEQSKPTKELLEVMAKVFLEEGIRFHSEHGFVVDKNVVTIYEGENPFLKVQEDILQSCIQDKCELLILGNDDSKCSKEIIAKDKEIYKAQIKVKNLIYINDDYILGPLENYRKISKDYFLNEDAIIIYGEKICFTIDVEEKPKYTYKTVVIKDKTLSNRFRNYFYNLWEKAEMPKYSSVKQQLFY